MNANSVPALISRNVGNTLSNYKTWNGILFNVKEGKHGAEGDGKTDDTSSIQTVVTAAGVTGGTVFFPPGTYMISSRLVIPSNVTLEGIFGASIIKMTVSAGPLIGALEAGTKENITVRGLTFIGNGVMPSNADADTALAFINCTNILVEQCVVTKFLGLGIAFMGGSNTKAINCRFVDHGQDMRTSTTKRAVPAIWIAYGNKWSKVLNCDFIDCRWSGVFLLGEYGEVSNCRLENIGESGIYTQYSDTSPTNYNIITNNNIDRCYLVDVTACGIECLSSNTIIIGNIIQRCDADGIALGTSSNCNVKNNTCKNNNFSNTLGSSGIGVSLINPPLHVTDGSGHVISGNICYDDQTVKTQAHGINVFSTGGLTYSNGVIEGNNFYNNAAANMNISPGIFELPTNRVRNNTGWDDVQSSMVSASTSSSTTVTLKSFSIPANSLGSTRGIKITTWGFIGGTANTKLVSLQFGNAVSDDISYLAADSGNYLFEVEIISRGTGNIQIKLCKMFKNGTVYSITNNNIAVDNSIDQLVSVLARVTNGTDTIACSGLIVERL